MTREEKVIIDYVAKRGWSKVHEVERWGNEEEVVAFIDLVYHRKHFGPVGTLKGACDALVELETRSLSNIRRRELEREIVGFLRTSDVIDYVRRTLGIGRSLSFDRDDVEVRPV